MGNRGGTHMAPAALPVQGFSLRSWSSCCPNFALLLVRFSWLRDTCTRLFLVPIIKCFRWFCMRKYRLLYFLEEIRESATEGYTLGIINWQMPYEMVLDFTSQYCGAGSIVINVLMAFSISPLLLYYRNCIGTWKDIAWHDTWLLVWCSYAVVRTIFLFMCFATKF